LVLAGEIYVPRHAISQILSEGGNDTREDLDGLPENNPLRQLTQRQRNTLALMIEGRSNKEIARSLNLLESTVKAHVKVILRKLSAHNRTQAALIAADLGWPRVRTRTS
jgi:DNA-binding NarL/FixJ family response regulator